VTFTWNAVSGATDYWIDVGTGSALGDISGGWTGGATTRTVDLSSYITGQLIYIQLYSKFPNIIRRREAEASSRLPPPEVIHSSCRPSREAP